MIYIDEDIGKKNQNEHRFKSSPENSMRLELRSVKHFDVEFG